MKRTKKREYRQPLLAMIGWVGVVAIVLAYTLNSFSLLASHDPLYLGLNLVGAIALIVEAHLHHDVPPLLLNGIWAVVAMIGLVRFLISI